MEETISQTQSQWSYGLLKNEAYVAPEGVRSSLEISNEELLIRIQGLSVSLFVHGKPVNLAPYLVYDSPNIAGMIPVQEYEGVVGGSHLGSQHFYPPKSALPHFDTVGEPGGSSNQR